MAEAIGNEVNEIVEKNHKGDITVDLDSYDDNKITMYFNVKGGYERDTNAYWGGDEYLDELIAEIKDIFQVKDAYYDLDHEDLTGTLEIEYVDTHSVPYLLVPNDNRLAVRRCSIHHGKNQNGYHNGFAYSSWKSQPVSDNPYYSLDGDESISHFAYERVLKEFNEKRETVRNLVLENRFQGVTQVGSDVFNYFTLVVNLKI